MPGQRCALAIDIEAGTEALMRDIQRVLKLCAGQPRDMIINQRVADCAVQVVQALVERRLR